MLEATEEVETPVPSTYCSGMSSSWHRNNHNWPEVSCPEICTERSAALGATNRRDIQFQKNVSDVGRTDLHLLDKLKLFRRKHTQHCP